MFIAMNRFKVIRGSETDFETVWTSRDTHLRDVPGFVTFHLLRGPEREDHTLFASHTIWASPRGFRGVDDIRSLPPRASRRRRQQAALPRPPGVRGFRRRAGNQRRLTRFVHRHQFQRLRPPAVEARQPALAEQAERGHLPVAGALHRGQRVQQCQRVGQRDAAQGIRPDRAVDIGAPVAARRVAARGRPGRVRR